MSFVTGMRLEDVNAWPREAFIARFRELFEHSPWVVERAEAGRPFDDVHAGLMAAVWSAPEADQLRLVRAHPQLAGKAAIDGTLTEASAAEQASAGLDRLTPAEHARFMELNARYETRMGFPFIICVRNHTKHGILDAMERRADNPPAEELTAALKEVSEIVRLRLETMS